MEETVYGSGTTSARNQTNVLAEAEGTLTDLRVSVGDAVKAGDILAVMTNADLDDTITDLEFDLWELDDQRRGAWWRFMPKRATMRWRFSAERARSPSSPQTAE